MPTFVFWYGGLLGLVATAALTLWALGLYTLVRASGRLAALLIAAAVVAAPVFSWTLLRSATLLHERQIHELRGPLSGLIASRVYVRGAVEDVRTAAAPSTALNDLLSQYDRHEASIDALLEAEWRYQRAAAWDERGLLHKLTWDVAEVRNHHARLERRDEALQCAPAPELPPLSDLVDELRGRLQTHRVNAAAVGEQFEGFSFPERERDGISDAMIIQSAGWLLGALALLCAGVAVFLGLRDPERGTRDPGSAVRDTGSAAREPDSTAGDGRGRIATSRRGELAVLAIAALALSACAAWLVAGAGAEQERLREALYGNAVTVFREALALNTAAGELSLEPRAAPAPPAGSAATLIADYTAHVNEVATLARLARQWSRAILTGVFEPDTVSSTRITTPDELVNAIRASTLTVYRGALRIGERIERLNCRSEWFAPSSGRLLERALIELPARR